MSGHGAGPAGERLEGYLARLDEVAAGLRRVAGTRPPAGALTEADPPTGERWEAGQVWAHLAEIVPYWIAEGRKVIDPGAAEPVPFGRVKTDAGRLAAIEAGRRREPAAQLATIEADIADLRRFLRQVDAAGAWSRTGVHSKLGEMGMPAIVEEFLVGHLEEHLEQLAGLAGG